MFRLPRFLSVAALTGFVVVAVLLSVLFRQLAVDHLVEIGQSKSVALTQAFSNSLWPEFAAFSRATLGLGTDELRDHAQVSTLRQAVRELTQGLSVVRVKVYGLDGRTIFSTDTTQIGEDKSRNAGYLAARSGKASSLLTATASMRSTRRSKIATSSRATYRSGPAARRRPSSVSWKSTRT